MLINLLTQYFQSSAYDGGSSQRQVPRNASRPTGQAHPTRPTKSQTKPTPVSTSTGARAPRAVPIQRKTLPRGTGDPVHVAGPRGIAQLPASRGGAKPTHPSKEEPGSSEVERLKKEVEQLKLTVARMEEQQSTMLLALLNREDFQQQLRSLIAAEVASTRSLSASATVLDSAVVNVKTHPGAELKKCDLQGGNCC